MFVLECGFVWSRDWTMSNTEVKRIEALEMWLWRRMELEKINWTAKVSKSEVLIRVEEVRCIINTIRQHRWLGHVLRHDVLLQDILEGRTIGN